MKPLFTMIALLLIALLRAIEPGAERWLERMLLDIQAFRPRRKREGG